VQELSAANQEERCFFTLFIRSTQQTLPRFYRSINILTLSIFIGEISMDIAYLLGGALLWVALVLMVKGLEKLEKPKGERA
jgi:hypothetical protein